MHYVIIVTLIVVAGVLLLTPDTVIPMNTDNSILKAIREHAQVIAAVSVAVAGYLYMQMEKSTHKDMTTSTQSASVSAASIQTTSE